MNIPIPLNIPSRRRRQSSGSGSLSRYRKHLILIMLAPVLPVTILFLILNTILIQKESARLKDLYRESVEYSVQSFENELKELSERSLLLMTSDCFRKVLLSDEAINPEDHQLLNECTELLHTYVNTKNLLYQAGFYSDSAQSFLSSSGIISPEMFRSSGHYGTLIQDPYTLRNPKEHSQDLKILGAEYLIGRGNEETSVITLLQYRIGTVQSPSPLVLWLDKDTLIRTLQKDLPDENCVLLLKDKTEESILLSTDPELLPSGSNSSGFDGDYLTFSSFSPDAVNHPLEFLLLVPKHTLHHMTMTSYILTVLIFSLCCISGFIVSCLISRRIYAPIAALARKVEQHTEAIEGVSGAMDHEIEYLTEHVSSLLDSRKLLEQTIDAALPALHTTYILNILIQEEYDNLPLEPILEKYPFHFPWESFTCAILQTELRDTYFSDRSPEERLFLHQKFIDMLRQEHAAGCAKYVFRVDGTHYCIIYNTFSDDIHTLIAHDFDQLCAGFTDGTEEIRLYLSAGSTVHTLHELSDSYRKARLAMSELSPCGQNDILFYHMTDSGKTHYRLDSSTESQLITSLIQGDEQAALSLTGEIISSSQKSGISGTDLTELYVDLYQAGKKAADRMQLDYPALLKDEYRLVSDFLGSMNNLQRSAYLSLFYQTLCASRSPRNASHLNGKKLKEYIDTHYTEDLYLELLAEQFHTSSKYMSRLLKNALGIPFKQYLNSLRIQYTKELLVKTDLKIEEIALRSGFNGRNTFIRLFKTMEGMTPSEYRKISSASKKP